ncbi:hypothetical protein [Parafannyhessea sp. LCP21S3_E6]|uniref:hypothetical protein n=1 Tax=unclassified Parafannyhessea TaxID=2847323 RepID=UPI003F96CB3E
MPPVAFTITKSHVVIFETTKSSYQELMSMPLSPIAATLRDYDLLAAAERRHDRREHRHHERHDERPDRRVEHPEPDDQVDVGDEDAEHTLHDRAGQALLPLVSSQELLHLMPPFP